MFAMCRLCLFNKWVRCAGGTRHAAPCASMRVLSSAHHCFCAQRRTRCKFAGCARARSLDYGDRVADGLYDAWGVFPELVHVPHGETGYGLPSLEELRGLPAWPGDPREVRRRCAPSRELSRPEVRAAAVRRRCAVKTAEWGPRWPTC